jgi:Calcineurin-like phosphoesterase
MSRLLGIGDRSAADQLQRSFAPEPAQPLPAPYSPARIQAADVGITDPGSPLTFFVLGDVGGIKAPAPQNAVSYAMQKRQGESAFALILGDVVYFNGQESTNVPGQSTGYLDQFYEAYAHYAKPILAFPGNHDGDPQPGDTSLSGFMANFCSATPAAPPSDPQLEFGRHTQTLKYCEWTLELEALTFIAAYTNVPSGGHLEPEQADRLTQELRDADPNKPVIVGLHHPPYSVDSHHGGSQQMGDILDQAFTGSGRVPDMVLSGHVHDYQRFTRTINGKPVPYIVSGNGGYHNLHQLASDASPGQSIASDVVFEFGDASQYGFMKLTVNGATISGEYIGVSPGTMPDGSDATITAGADTF